MKCEDLTPEPTPEPRLKERGEVNADNIFGNPIYEQIIGSYDEVNRLFDGRLAEVIQEMQDNFHLPQLAKGAA